MIRSCRMVKTFEHQNKNKRTYSELEQGKLQEQEKQQFFVGERHNFFTNRVAPSWNMLPSDMINFSSLNGFKAALDKYTENGHLST